MAGVERGGNEGHRLESPGARIAVNRDLWRAEIVLADEAAYLRHDLRTRNFMAAVISVAGLAVVFWLMQAGRAYLGAVELARRQSEFMAAVSHEMRTPLAAMRLLAENLASGVADRAGQREDHTRMIREECSRLGDLVDNVLARIRDRSEIAPVLDLESPDIPHRKMKPRQCFEGEQGGEQVGHIVRFRDIDAALDPLEPECSVSAGEVANRDRCRFQVRKLS